MTTKAKEVTGEVVKSTAGALKLPTVEAKLLAELKKSGTWLDKVEKDWAELPDVETKEGMALAKSRRAELVSNRTGGNDNRLLITKPARNLVDMVNGLWKGYSPRMQILEDKYDVAIKEIEFKKAEAKRLREEADAERIAAIEKRIEVIKAAPLRANSLETVNLELEILNDTDNELFADFEEFDVAAQIHIDTAKAALETRRADLVKAEEDRKALEKQRTEQAAAQKRIDDANAEIARKQKEHDDAVAQLAADKKKLADDRQAEDDRIAKAETDRIAAIKQAILKISSAVDLAVDLNSASSQLWDVSAFETFDFQEFEEEGKKAVDDANAALKTKHEAFKAQEAAAETERLAQAKRDQDAKDAETVANANRIAAMMPEIERLRTWFESIQNANMPVVESPEAMAITKVYDDAISGIDDMLSALELRKVA